MKFQIILIIYITVKILTNVYSTWISIIVDVYILSSSGKSCV